MAKLNIKTLCIEMFIFFRTHSNQLGKVGKLTAAEYYGNLPYKSTTKSKKTNVLHKVIETDSENGEEEQEQRNVRNRLHKNKKNAVIKKMETVGKRKKTIIKKMETGGKGKKK